MTAFIAWAALCALAAAAFIALPLVRVRGDGLPPQRALGALSAALLLVGGGVLYPLWGGYHGLGGGRAAGQGIETLLAATDQHPEDVQAWLELGRGYLQIQQWPLARRSFQRADRLSGGRNALALSGIAQTMVFEGGGVQSEAAQRLFARALEIDPHSPQALFYTGVAALQAGDLPQARARFAALRAEDPPAEVSNALDRQIAAIDAQIQADQPDPATAIHLRIRVAPGLQAAAIHARALFVFVRAPAGGAPLAVKRLGPSLPQAVVLSAHDAMVPANAPRPGQTVRVVARLSVSGTPTESPGDLSGELVCVAGRAGTQELVITSGQPQPAGATGR